MAKANKELNTKEKDELLTTLKQRFEKNMQRHKETVWSTVSAKLEANPDKLWSLFEMERTGGEPDVVSMGTKEKALVFCDCSPESPKDRRSFCYDAPALRSRKEHKPKNNAMDAAEAMGVELLTEEEYLQLQSVGSFDTKTSSWLRTPDAVRGLGGAIFGDRRYDRVFIYHNGAESYYAARGFRSLLRF